MEKLLVQDLKVMHLCRQNKEAPGCKLYGNEWTGQSVSPSHQGSVVIHMRYQKHSSQLIDIVMGKLGQFHLQTHLQLGFRLEVRSKIIPYLNLASENEFPIAITTAVKFRCPPNKPFTSEGFHLLYYGFCCSSDKVGETLSRTALLSMGDPLNATHLATFTVMT